jgi:hypothetical protein
MTASTTGTPQSAAPGRPEAQIADRMFDHDPVRTARRQLLIEIQRAASSPAPNDLADGYARASVAADLLALRAGDDDTRTEFCEAVDGKLHRLASAPALTVDDVMSKIAGLVLELARGSDHGEFSHGPLPFILASCALADLVILRGGPISLPRHAFDAIDTPEILAHWRRQAAEDMR